MSKYFEHYVDDDGTVDDQLTLTSDAHASLTYDIEELVEKYTGESAFGKCSEIRNDMVDLIHQIINGEEISGLRQCQVCKNSYNIYEDESKMIMDIREILECPEKMIEKWESKNKDICLHDWFCSDCCDKVISYEELSDE